MRDGFLLVRGVTIIVANSGEIAEIQDKKRATEENKKTVTKERRQMSTQDKRRASWQKVKDGQRSIETKNQLGKKQKQVQRKSRNRY